MFNKLYYDFKIGTVAVLDALIMCVCRVVALYYVCLYSSVTDTRLNVNNPSMVDVEL